MSFPLPENSPPELATTRVSGGASARLIALAVAGVLVAVVGFTVINRPAPAQPQPTLGVAVFPDVAGPSPSPTAGPLDITVLTSDYGYAAVLQITGGNLYADLKRDSPEDYRASVVLNWADLGRKIPIRISRVWSAGGPVIYDDFGAWMVRLKGLRDGRGPVGLLVAHVPPNGAPLLIGPVETGYTFTVMGTRNGRELDLQLDLFWPDH